MCYVDSVSCVPVHVWQVELAMLAPAAVKPEALESAAPVGDQLEIRAAASLLNLVEISALVTAGFGGMGTEKVVAAVPSDMEIVLGAATWEALACIEFADIGVAEYGSIVEKAAENSERVAGFAEVAAADMVVVAFAGAEFAEKVAVAAVVAAAHVDTTAEEFVALIVVEVKTHLLV